MLKNISIDQIKRMNNDELAILAKELRQQIITTVSQNGGHLSSNLGIVELTIALHKTFNSPKDLIIFDVSHQTYAHKLITGRYHSFSTLRKMNGISGFSRRVESEHDIFEGGHSSTSISAGLGFLEAKSAGADIGEVIVVIGDASIVNGLAFEALNYLGGHPKQKMIIILNDNEMSISKNVGGLAKHFNNIRAQGKWRLLRKITPRSVKKMIKSYAYQSNLFESLGIKYFEGIDGHNFKELFKYLQYAKNSSGSVVLHVRTKKGLGYRFAEEDKTGVWHSIEGFDIESGTINGHNNNKISFGEGIADYLMELVANQKEIRVITPAMSLGSGLTNFSYQYPNHFIDVGIAEEHAVVMASAMSIYGITPFVFIYATFFQRAYDELLHDVTRSNQKVIFCVDRCGIVEGDGDTHQGIFDLAMYSTLPNLVVLAPKCIEDIKPIVDIALNYQGPIIIRYPKYGVKSLVPNSAKKEIGKWEILKNGKNYIISYGPDILEIMSNIDIPDIGFINAFSINPIDQNLLKELFIQNQTLYVYENVIENGSLGQKIILFAAQLLKEGTISNYNVQTIVLPNSYLEVGTIDEIRTKYHVAITDLKNLIGD